MRLYDVENEPGGRESERSGLNNVRKRDAGRRVAEGGKGLVESIGG